MLLFISLEVEMTLMEDLTKELQNMKLLVEACLVAENMSIAPHFPET
jgi:hypothetical protein